MKKLLKLLIFIVFYCCHNDFEVSGKSVIDGFCHPKCFEKCLPSCTCCNIGADNSERRNKIKRRILENVLKQKQLEVGFVCHSYCKTRCLPSCKFSCCEKQNSTEEVGERSIVFEEGFDLSKLLKSLQETQKEYRKFKTYIGKLHHNATHRLHHTANHKLKHHQSSKPTLKHPHKSKLKNRDNLLSDKSEHKTNLKSKKIKPKKESKKTNSEVTAINKITSSNEVANDLKSKNDEKQNVSDTASFHDPSSSASYDPASFVLPSKVYNAQLLNQKPDEIDGYENEVESNLLTEVLEDQHSGFYQLPLNPQENPRSESTTQHLPPHGNFIYNPFYVSEELKELHISKQKNKKKKSIKKKRGGKKNIYQNFREKSKVKSDGNKIKGNGDGDSDDDGKKNSNPIFDNLLKNQNLQSLEDSKETEKVKALDNKRKITKALKEIENLQTTIKESIEKKIQPTTDNRQSTTDNRQPIIIEENIEKKIPTIIENKQNANLKIEIPVETIKTVEPLKVMFKPKKLKFSTHSKPHNFKKLKPAPSMFQEFQELDSLTYKTEQPYPEHSNILDKKQNKGDKIKFKKKRNRNLHKQVSKSNYMSYQNDNSSYLNTYDSKTNQESFALKSSNSVTESNLQQPSVSLASDSVSESTVQTPSASQLINLVTENLIQQPSVSQSSNSVNENLVKQPNVMFPDSLTNYPIVAETAVQNNAQQANQNEPYSQQANQCAASCGMLCSPFCENTCCETSIYQKYLEPKNNLKPTSALQIQAPKSYEGTYTQSPIYGDNTIYGDNAPSKDTSAKAVKLSEATLSATRHRIQDLISLLQETSKNIETNNVANTNVCHVGCKRHCLPSCHFECC